MKRLYSTIILLSLFAGTAIAQLSGMNPNQASQGQSLQTVITGNSIFIQSSSPSGNLYQIKLQKGTDLISIFDWNQFLLNATVDDPNTVTADFTVPLTVSDGLYDLTVITGDVTNPWTNQNTYTLPGAFTILPPDGYISGTVYNDLNRNGVQDPGEPGLSNRTVKLLPSNYTLGTNSTGNYSFPAFNGSYSVVILNNLADQMFVTTANDTLPVTINNGNSTGNDFGLKTAMFSILPNTGYKGINTTHQIVADEPIFITGANPNGNITQFVVFSAPSINVVPSTNITIIDSYTIRVNINVPVGTAVGNNLDIRIYLSNGVVGYHYLKQQFNVAVPPVLISGNVFFDPNQNKMRDPGEPGLNGAKLILTPDSSIAFTNQNGDFQLGSLGGPVTLTYLNNLADLVITTDSTSYTFNASGTITGKDFGLASSAPDYTISLNSLYLLPRCNTVRGVSFNVKNQSNYTYNAIAWLQFDPLMSFSSASPAPSFVSNDTVYWSISNLAPFQQIQVVAYFLLPGAGNQISITAGAISLDGSGNPQLSARTEGFYTILCSLDPNDKQVTPEGIFTQHYTLMSDTLNYLIRFQNTGNDTAFTVVLIDTLDSNLDKSTFEVTGSSHSVRTELKNNGKLIFTFDNILLPDSNVNEPGSNGFVQYRIRAKAGLPDETVVENTAAIYFDLNLPVVTNTTMNTMVYVLPVGLPEPSQSKNGVTIYPNPFNDFTTMVFENTSADEYRLLISDLTGKVVMPARFTTGNIFVVNKDKMRSGIYFYQLLNSVSGKTVSGKLVIE